MSKNNLHHQVSLDNNDVILSNWCNMAFRTFLFTQAHTSLVFYGLSVAQV